MLVGEVCQNLVRRGSVEADNIQVVAAEPKIRNLEQNLRAIGRSEGIVSERGDFLFKAVAPENGNNKQAALAIFRTVSNVFPIG